MNPTLKETLIALSLMIAFSSCQPDQDPSKKNKSTPTKPQLKSATPELDVLEKSTTTYEIQDPKQWLLNHSTDSLQHQIVFALNRTDRSNFPRMDSVVVPMDLSSALANYLPFPLEVSYLKDITKIIFFSYPTQTFAAYEKGKLVRTGPTNMGRKKKLTPTGLFYTNWKAKVTRSTINTNWILRWNFNILNKAGVGWHQYSLPGYPVSHSCLRLQEMDAYFLYNWADQWVLANSTTIQVKGTPVIIFGKYDFGSPKPWLKLITNPHVLDINEDELEKITQPYLNEILSEQQNRETGLANTK